MINNTRLPQSPTMVTTPVVSTKEFQSSHFKDIEFPSVPQHEQEHQRARVHFAIIMDENDHDSQSAPHKELTAQMIEDMWYTYEQIDEFKQDVRSIVIRKTKKELVTDDEMMGLEKYNPQRSEYKRSALYHILRAQSKSRDPEFIRAVSRRSTAWARAIANEQGFKDYCDVYDPLDDLLDFDNLESAMDGNNDDDSIQQKRTHELGDIQVPSSKRQRLSR